MLKSILRKIESIFKVSVLSSIISFVITFGLIVLNAIMGVFIGLEYYFMLFAGLTLCLTIMLVVVDYNRIFKNKKHIQKTKVSKNKNIKRGNTREVVKAKRKIS